jgi:hypothetical protein
VFRNAGVSLRAIRSVDERETTQIIS